MPLSLRLLACIPIAGAAILIGCGGGGTSPTPNGNATAAPPIGGFVAASGPVTLLAQQGGAFGSTILNAASTAVFVLQDASTPATVSSTNTTLTTTALTAAETAGQSASSVRRAASVTIADLNDPETRRRTERVQTSDLRDVLRHFAAHATIGRAGLGVRRPEAQINDARTFQLQGGTISGSITNPTPIPVPAHLLAQSAHANVWLADVDANATEFPAGVTADMQAVTTRFERDYAIETAAFGPFYTASNLQFEECGPNGTPLNGTPDPGFDTTTSGGDPRMNIVITNALAGSGEGGYFYGLDLFSQSEANCIQPNPPTVNATRMIVLGSNQYPPMAGFATNKESYWLNEDMPQTLGHELQHYLHFANKYLGQIAADLNNPNAGTIDNTFIDEGCSVLAQDLVAVGDDPREPESPSFVRSFLLEPNLFSLTSFSAYQPDPTSTNPSPPYAYFHNTSGNYGLSYLFIRYLYDRFGGANALHAIYAAKSQANALGVDTGPATQAAGGEAFAQLYREFATAVAVHAGGSGPEVTADARYQFSPFVVLRGSLTVFSRRNGNDTRTIVQPGPMNPEIFSNNQPVLANDGSTARQILSPGQSLTLSLITGATTYLTPSGTPAGGATLRAQNAVPTFQGSLGQGPIPTPSPDFF